jgi:hypothetical protein
MAHEIGHLLWKGDEDYIESHYWGPGFPENLMAEPTSSWNKQTKLNKKQIEMMRRSLLLKDHE